MGYAGESGEEDAHGHEFSLCLVSVDSELAGEGVLIDGGLRLHGRYYKFKILSMIDITRLK